MLVSNTFRCSSTSQRSIDACITGAVAAIDGTHIPCHVPVDLKQAHYGKLGKGIHARPSYCTRLWTKSLYSTKQQSRVQDFARYSCLFLFHSFLLYDVSVGWPGSGRDSSVLKGTPLYARIMHDGGEAAPASAEDDAVEDGADNEILYVYPCRLRI